MLELIQYFVYQSHSVLFDIGMWFLSQTGKAGIVLCALSVIGALVWLVRYQLDRNEKKKVASIYAVIGFAILGSHFLVGMPQHSITTTTSSRGEATHLTSRSSVPSYSLDKLETRLKSRASRSRGERSQSYLTEDGEFPLWMLVSGGLALLALVLLRRSHPDLVSVSAVTSVVGLSKWIRPNRSKSNELGSGDMATTKEIKRWMTPSNALDTRLPVSDVRNSSGIVFRSGELIIAREQRNRNMLIIAKTGSGKTTRLVLPILYSDCMCRERSTVIIDSKQEMWDKLAGMTRKFNPDKNVIMFNPLDIVRSLSWNILAKVESDTDCKLIANSVVTATDDPNSRQDSPFFRNSALQVLNGVMVGLMHDPNERLSMPRIHELINKGMKELCDWLEAHPRSIRTTKAFVDLARNGSQNADTIMSELSMRLQAWDLKAIRSTTFADEIDIEKIIMEPSLFVVELRESELKMLRPLANVIVVEMLRYLTKYAEECPGQTLPRPVGLVIDEFASALGRLPDIHIKLNTLRSRNVSIVAAIQSIGQIKGNYGEDWESVLSGFSSKIFMPSLDFTDSEWASKESGIMTVRYKTSSKGTNRRLVDNFSHINNSMNEQIQQRAVLTPDEIGRPSDSQATFFMPETPVFQGHLTPFYKVPEMLKRISGYSKPEHIVHQRESPIEYEEVLPEAITAEDRDKKESEQKQQPVKAAASNPKGVTQLLDALEKIKAEHLDWENTTGDAKKWWVAFEEANKTRVALVLKVAQEIKKRGATITDFFLAYVYSNTDNIEATLAYLDYTMHMKSSKEGKKKATA